MMDVEVVVSGGSVIVYDEIGEALRCQGCGAAVSELWSFCPDCGEPVSGRDAYEPCRNVSGNPSLWTCSACGRTYVPVQIRDDGGTPAEWSACPGCGGRVGDGRI